ncbi:MAG TPA: response regulator, partial [Thermoanaerobaculia bacterium]|nr:response regulator [Thermoanaerobaculia bacterium]
NGAAPTGDPMGKKILLADDSVTIQKVVELTFMDEDHEVVAVSNGDEALHRLHDVRPDLVIADVHMPGIGGYEVCRRAKEEVPGLPVLLLVGTFEPFREDEARACGADGFLKKPFDSQELLRRVDELLAAAPEAAPEGAVDEGAPVADEPATEEDEEDPWGGGRIAALPDEPVPLSPEDLAGYSLEPVEEGEEEAAAPLEIAAEELEIERSPWAEAEEMPEPLPVAEAPPVRPQVEPPPSAEEAPEPPAAVEVPASPAPGGGAEAAATGGMAAATGAGALSDEDVERVARRVVELMGDRLLREVAWEVVPDLAELAIKERIRELERQLE